MGMREEFEAWAGLRSMMKAKLGDGSYVYERTQVQWEAWQASRAALVVTLPKVTYKQNPDPETDVEVRIRNEMRVQLTDAGVSYK